MNCVRALNYFDDRDKLIIGMAGFIIVYEAAMRILRKIAINRQPYLVIITLNDKVPIIVEFVIMIGTFGENFSD